ncbi:hypothetical protein [Amaricoccus solimangrovi]|uniref:Uncharacterized protein n=1 Tax=Amaricoccus solimangrovi TaxID=2589815 RepID=A0A501WPB9_9RHOB|nr:hypothetical protein [Amaricoccus solimangrovi]TPE50175.1 hypothetical protein FJM51_12380 [Amaricoccus solimangrovi]
MRLALALLLLGLGAWQAVSDWNATIGVGYAYRLTPVGQVLADAAPDFYARLMAVWQATRIPFLWDPLGRRLMALPMALVLIVPGALLWVRRRRRR